ncbi:hypothetical protein BACPLE_02828 [Phocaeicola plebeius DSM 17135]|uniref:Uncharacterized protein n=1 Tax=Phocaeicola plebeius (strain DSM 17135 / JCM 12973 / CCUG 54634 / M2) TaxID=484018 RepID=B5D1I4_PHOPM|nr:hypothetical protein BACPLE_02828 [Phocaeicola plebeius DSM 17135]
MDKKILSNYKFCRFGYCNKVVQAYNRQTGKTPPEKKKRKNIYK